MLRRIALLLSCVCVLSGGPAPCADAPPLEDGPSLVRTVYRLADQRLALMPAVAAAKWSTGAPIHAPDREAQVIASVGQRAEQLGLDPQPVRELFALQIRLANELQERLIGAWSAGAAPPVGPPPALATELRPQIDRIGNQFVEALYLAAPYVATQGSDAGRGVLDPDRFTDADRDALERAIARVRLASPASLERARQAGVLRVGLPADYAPFAFFDSDRLAGSDVALTGLIARSLGLRPVYIRTAWGRLLDDLAKDRFDLAAGGISVTATRATVGTFSTPVARGGKTALGRCSDRARFGSDAQIDRPGVRVIENSGGTNEQFARRHLTQATLLLHPDNTTIFEELVGERADVMYTDDLEIERLVRRETRLCRLTGEVFEPADKALLAPRDSGFAEAADRWLASPEAQGVPARLLEDATHH